MAWTPQELLGLWRHTFPWGCQGHGQLQWWTSSSYRRGPASLRYISSNVNLTPSIPILISPHHPSASSPRTQQPPPSLANFHLFPEFKMPVAREGSHEQLPRSSELQARKDEWESLCQGGPASEVYSIQIKPWVSMNLTCLTWFRHFINLSLEANDLASKQNH